jgi:hypothetical protein
MFSGDAEGSGAAPTRGENKNKTATQIRTNEKGNFMAFIGSLIKLAQRETRFVSGYGFSHIVSAGFSENAPMRRDCHRGLERGRGLWMVAPHGRGPQIIVTFCGRPKGAVLIRIAEKCALNGEHTEEETRIKDSH